MECRVSADVPSPETFEGYVVGYAHVRLELLLAIADEGTPKHYKYQNNPNLNKIRTTTKTEPIIITKTNTKSLLTQPPQFSSISYASPTTPPSCLQSFHAPPNSPSPKPKDSHTTSPGT